MVMARDAPIAKFLFPVLEEVWPAKTDFSETDFSIKEITLDHICLAWVPFSKFLYKYTSPRQHFAYNCSLNHNVMLSWPPSPIIK